MQLSLDQMLNYQNEEVFARYEKDFPQASLSAEQAMQEFIKFVWLFHQHREDKLKHPENEKLDFKCVIHKEMSDIDNMWHTFLLFTKDYHQFCDDYLQGVFFHHVPMKKDDKPVSKELYSQELERYLSYIYDSLGEKTLITWFPDYFRED